MVSFNHTGAADVLGGFGSVRGPGPNDPDERWFTLNLPPGHHTHRVGDASLAKR